MRLNEALRNISDALFPPQCLSCTDILQTKAQKVFCPVCLEKITLITENICPVCGIIFPDSPAGSHLCGHCLENEPHFCCARSVASFESVILDAIHQFKYGRNLSTGTALADFMADFPFPDFDFSAYSLMIPVPLHIKRLRERGFNQSLILAQTVGKKHHIPVNFSLLKRNKFTLTQTGFNRKEREQNIKGAFIVKDRNTLQNASIILIDDVYTTGATINECAKELMNAGAQKVAVLTLARVL